MKEYEVLKESINPCGGEQYAIKEFMEIETADPAAFVDGNTRFPIMDQGKNSDGDLVIIPQKVFHRTGGRGGLRFLVHFTDTFLEKYFFISGSSLFITLITPGF